MVFWEFLFNLIVIGQLAVLPTAWFSTIDYQSDINKISFINSNDVEDNWPNKIVNDSLGVDITAKSAIATDWETGVVLWQKNVNEQRSIASLTKLMTVLVWSNFNPDLDAVITIQESDYREGGRFYLFKGEKVLTKDLLKSVLIASDNNATIALARSTGLTLDEFVKKMNEKAKELNMANSVFVEPSGLDNGNKSTVSDLVILANEVFADNMIRDISSTEETGYFILNNNRYNRVQTTNTLLGTYLNIISGKTGFSENAGGCLLALAKGDDNQKVLIIILGSADRYVRFQEGKSLTQWVFNNFVWPSASVNR